MNQGLVPDGTHALPPAHVTLVIPCLAEYVGIARLAILGIANRIPFSYDEVEDVRLAVGEACTHAIERARTTPPVGDGPSQLRIESYLTSMSLTIEVHDSIPVSGESEEPVSDDGIDRPGLGALLMEILVDEVTIEANPAGTVVRLTKHAPKI